LSRIDLTLKKTPDEGYLSDGRRGYQKMASSRAASLIDLTECIFSGENRKRSRPGCQILLAIRKPSRGKYRVGMMKEKLVSVQHPEEQLQICTRSRVP